MPDAPNGLASMTQARVLTVPLDDDHLGVTVNGVADGRRSSIRDLILVVGTVSVTGI